MLIIEHVESLSLFSSAVLDDGAHMRAKSPVCIVELAALLHEQGHIAFGHMRYDGIGLMEVILQEAQAWAYALRCVKPRYRAQIMEVCAWAMASYIYLLTKIAHRLVVLEEFKHWLGVIEHATVEVE